MGERQLPELYPGWKTVRKLGSGSFGTVYEIERDLFGKIEKAALKCIAIPQNDGDVEEMYSNGYDDASITAHFETYLANIVREYSMMVEMKGHTNVVYCDDIRYVPREDGIGWDITIKMELLTPLIKTLGPDFGEEQVIRLGKDLCRALALCKDRDIVHRDIKPQNIFVSKTGDYKLGDFGIAKTVEQTTGGTKIGTYSYMAPEVYHNKPYGSSADIYSLGLVMYWLLNERRLPFLPLPPKSPTYDETETARHRRFMGEEIPGPQKGSEELKKIVLKACAFDPQDRFASAQEMLDALDSMGQAEPVVNKMDMYAKTSVTEAALDETCGPVFGTVSAATATMTEGPVFTADATMTEGPVFTSREVREDSKTKDPVFAEKPAAEPKTAEEPSWKAEHREEKMGPRTIEVPKQVPQPVEKQPPQKNKLWIIGACAAVVLAVIGFAFYSMYHVWSDPTCTAPATCSICGKTQGTTARHQWVEADCVNAEYCSVCGEMGVDAFGHSWQDFDCITAKTCGVCGYTSGEFGEHKWMEATRTAPATCTLCGITDGTPILPYLKQTNLSWGSSGASVGNSAQPVVVIENNRALLSYPERDEFLQSQITVKNGNGDRIAETHYLIEWVDKMVCFTPAESLPVGVYHITCTFKDGDVELSVCYGYEGEIYPEHVDIGWNEFGFQNWKNEKYLVKTVEGLATSDSKEEGTCFWGSNEICGIKVSADGEAIPVINSNMVNFQTKAYRLQGNEHAIGLWTFVYDGWYLASDSKGIVYFSKEITEECYWRAT